MSCRRRERSLRSRPRNDPGFTPSEPEIPRNGVFRCITGTYESARLQGFSVSIVPAGGIIIRVSVSMRCGSRSMARRLTTHSLREPPRFSANRRSLAHGLPRRNRSISREKLHSGLEGRPLAMQKVEPASRGTASVIVAARHVEHSIVRSNAGSRRPTICAPRADTPRPSMDNRGAGIWYPFGTHSWHMLIIFGAMANGPGRIRTSV
jgi:hypothetical protein